MTILTDRHRLPNRRLHISFEFNHYGLRYTCGLGYNEGKVAEIFLNSAKADSDLDVAARDAAIAASIAIQYGASLQTLFNSMTRNPDGSASGPLGKAISMVLKGEV